MGQQRLVAHLDDVPPGDMHRVDVDGHPICVARAKDGQVYVIDDTCTHEEESLSDGYLEGCEVECPRHLSAFDLETGEALSLPATEPVQTYPVIVNDGAVYIEWPDNSTRQD